MTTLPDPQPLNLDALLSTIYAIQVDLKLLVEQLARERNPDLTNDALHTLAWFHVTLQRHTPSLMRH